MTKKIDLSPPAVLPCSLMLLNGKAIAAEIQKEVKERVKKIAGREPTLAVVLVGEHPPSEIYVSRKVAACEAVGIQSIRRILPKEISEEALLKEIDILNRTESVDGILVQLPLPAHIDSKRILNAIDPKKDVDGLHPTNLGNLLAGTPTFVPCTPLGILTLLQKSAVKMQGAHVVIVGRSALVGKPLAALFLQKGVDATVTVAHSQTKNLATYTKSADILIAAVGVPQLINADMVKEGVVVVDVGISRTSAGIVGDVDFASVEKKASLITPVPGGVGPMTIAMLLSNTLQSYFLREGNPI